MSDVRTRPISERKKPQQARSNDLVAAILDAAQQVLAAEGAHRFTTGRVAERAGVSVGSLYQYFPNKAAILFRLQSDEWRQTTDMVQKILNAQDRPALDRLRRLVHAFVRSEVEEAGMRGALDAAAPSYRDAPEAILASEMARDVLSRFMDEVLPLAEARRKRVAADLTLETLSVVGKRLSEILTHEAEREEYCDALADMLCGHIERLMVPN